MVSNMQQTSVAVGLINKDEWVGTLVGVARYVYFFLVVNNSLHSGLAYFNGWMDDSWELDCGTGQDRDWPAMAPHLPTNQTGNEKRDTMRTAEASFNSPRFGRAAGRRRSGGVRESSRSVGRPRPALTEPMILPCLHAQLVPTNLPVFRCHAIMFPRQP